MTYNIDFLIAAMVILLLVLWYFLGQKRAEDLNNQVFLFFAVIGILDVVAELASNYYRNLLGGLYRENPVKSRNYEAVKSSKKWENVGNSYIIPALLLYRYSYI